MELDNDALYRQFLEQTSRVKALSDVRDSLSDVSKTITALRRRENQAFQLQRVASDEGNAFIAVTDEFSGLLHSYREDIEKRARQLHDEIELYASTLDEYLTRLRGGDSETNEGASDDASDDGTETNEEVSNEALDDSAETTDATETAYSNESWG